MNDQGNENHYAVVVGIDRYPGVRDLRHARRDAEAIVTWLRSRDGGHVPATNVKEVMADPASETGFTVETAEPTHVQVDDALTFVNREIRKKVAEDPASWESSRLYFYASGHGIAPGSGIAAVLMANVDADPLLPTFGNNVELTLYEDWYRACGPFREVLLFADCCRDRDFTAKGHGPPWNLCTEAYGAANTGLGLGTTFGSPAFEPKEGDDGHGYFTQALIDGLRGGAADPLTGKITTTSLGEYVARAVPVLTENKRYPQVPTMPFDIAKPIVLRPPIGALAPIRRRVTIEFPAGYAGEVGLVLGRTPTGDRWRADDGPWQIELDEGIYKVQPSNGAPVQFRENGIFDVIAKDRDVKL